MEINFTLIVQAVNFLIAYALLRMFFFKPVLRAIKQEDGEREELVTTIEKRTQQLREKENEKHMQWVECQKYFAHHAPAFKLRITRRVDFSQPELLPLDTQVVKQEIVKVQENIVQRVSSAINTMQEKDRRA